MELPRDNTGLLILRDTGELVSSADLPEAGTGDVIALDEPGLVIEPNAISVDLSSDLSLDEDLSLSAPPPPPPSSVVANAPPVARPVPVAPAAFALPPPVPPPHFDLAPPPRHDSGYGPRLDPPMSELRSVLGTPVLGTPVGPPPRAASAPRPIGKTVGDSGLKPLAPRIVGLAPAAEPPPVAISPRRAQVGPRAIKERDRRSTSEIEVPLSPLEAPGGAGAGTTARTPAATPAPAARAHKAEVCYDQAVADFRAGNRGAAENGLKLAATYAPGELRYKQALERLRAGLEP